MMAPQVFVLHSMISLFGIGDTSDAHLAIIVANTAQQISELQKLLEMTGKTSRTLNQALELTQKVQEGIDQAMRTKENTLRFKRAIERLKNVRELKEARYNVEELRDYMDRYQRLFPDKAKKILEQDHETEETDAVRAELKRERLSELERLSQEVSVAKPERANQLQADIQVKQLEQMMLLQEELYELRKQNRYLVENERRRKAQEDLETLSSQHFLEHSISGSNENRRGR